ncbi:MAG: universal stress protein [Chloroflexi bacterium]|nr:universal stress protein [Chloroflexota bacterium]
MALKRILVPLDGSSLAESVLEVARSLAAALGAELYLLHVVPAPATPASSLALERSNPQENPQTYLQALARKIGGKTKVTWSVTTGDPASEILRFLGEHQVDQIAMATYGWAEGGSGPVGQVAGRVLQEAPVPVTLVKVPASRRT